HETPLNRERTDGRQHVAAIGRGVDRIASYGDLREEVLDVDTRPLGAPHDHRLARKAVASTDAVDLPDVFRAHHSKQRAMKLRDVVRKVGREEERTLRRATAHHHAGYAGQHRMLSTCGRSPA